MKKSRLTFTRISQVLPAIAVLSLALSVCGCSKAETAPLESSEQAPSPIDYAPETDFKVNATGDGACIVGYMGSGGEVNIPETIDGKPVIRIGVLPFYGAPITSVTIPDSVTKIGQGAFRQTQLTYVILPENVTGIDEDAFLNCEQLESVTLPEGLSKICPNTFSGCVSLKDITIPDAVTEIGEFAFSSCTSLTDITLPDNLQTISKRAFYECPGITVTYKGTSYMYDMLEELYDTINGEEDIAKEVLDTFFKFEDNEDGVTITYVAGWMGTGFCSGQEGVVEIPDKYDGKPVTELGYNTFINCNDVTIFTVPDTVTRIGSSAFLACNNLTEIILPVGITEIAGNTFAECHNLSTIKIPAKVTKIGDGAFRECTSLNVIIIPDGVTEIGYYAFKDCSDLDMVSLPDSMRSIQESTFENCENLTVTYKGTMYKYEEINTLYDAINNQ